MDITGISNMALPMMSPVGQPGEMSLPRIGATGLSPAALGRMDQLVHFIAEFSTAEVLMALLMANTPVHHHSASHAIDSAATAGLGLAQAGQAAGIGAGAAFAALPSISAGAMGGQISVQG